MKRSNVFSVVLAVFVLIAVLVGAKGAEAAMVDFEYIWEFALYRDKERTHPFGDGDVLELDPGAPVRVYVGVVDTNFVKVSNDLDFTAVVSVATTPQTVGVNSTAPVNLQYESGLKSYETEYSDFMKGGDFQIYTDGLLEIGVVNLQLVTTLFNINGEQITNENVAPRSKSVLLRVGYDDDNGGGSCNALGIGATVFLLPAIPLLTAYVKRKKTPRA
jgi:hypothetical protein